jgi:D-tyrosyl-tRNA(Tyr) deacylase
VDGDVVGAIQGGLVVLAGFVQGDSSAELDSMVRKLIHLRIFPDHQNRMNLSVLDVGGEVLAISQFTLAADTRKGRRPSFISAAPAELARNLMEEFTAKLRAQGVLVETGVFQADMKVELVNDGPVTIILDSKDWV